MAVIFHNSLLLSADYIRITRRYSSPQSISRAHKNGDIRMVSIGRLRFAYAMPAEVAAFHAIETWEGLSVITKESVPGGLASLSSISKKTGVGESLIISWALLQRLDVYWIGGVFFAHMHVVKPMAEAERSRKSSHTKPPRVRRKRRYL